MMVKQKYNNWVDANETLPEEFGKYLVRDGTETEVMFYYGTHKNNPDWSSHSCVSLNVTHWMPLPELPEHQKDYK